MKTYTNPIIPHEKTGRVADPYVIRHDGLYYHCYCQDDGVYISKSENLCDIGKAERVRVYEAKDGFCDWFAPELHFLDGSWHIYVAPLVDGNDLHSMVVLENKSSDPMGQYKSLGVMKGLEGVWSIDGTVLEHEGKRYFIWTKCTEMFMTEMDTPWSLKGEHIHFCKPEHPYECKTPDCLVNEGPAVLKKNGKIHVVFSANDSKTDEYCLGVMTYSGGEITNMNNWQKSKTAYFEKTEDIFGPGHCSFTTVSEGTEEIDYIVYHANEESGSGWNGRSVWIQPFSWDDRDFPVFGKPER